MFKLSFIYLVIASKQPSFFVKIAEGRVRFSISFFLVFFFFFLLAITPVFAPAPVIETSKILIVQAPLAPVE